MILAAGFGKRLRPLTSYYAKPAIPLLGRPLIEYALRKLARAGVEEAVVNLHHRAETLASVLDRSSREIRIHRSDESALLGTAGGLKNVQSLLEDGPFLLLNGDTLMDYDLGRLEEFHYASKARATLVLRRRTAGTSYSAFRIAGDGRILAFERRDPRSELMFSGVWLLDPAVFSILSGSPRGLEEELLPRLIQEGTAFGVVSDGAWITIDTPKRYFQASLLSAREGLFEQDWGVRRRPIEVVDGVGAVALTGSDARVDEGVRFRGVVILGARCTVGRGSTLENVVCWDDVSIPSGASLSNTVVTHGVSIPAGAELRDKLILKLGYDRSGLRRREIRDGLVVAELKSGRLTSAVPTISDENG
jgi:NDP-sugar pyrophosphorylase family protein